MEQYDKNNDISLADIKVVFTPPFDRSPRDPGYITGYLPGIRENGEQYIHAAIWTAWVVGPGTPALGWMYRLGIEAILGIKRLANPSRSRPASPEPGPVSR